MSDSKEACVKHGPMPDFRSGGYWCDCAWPYIKRCKRDRATPAAVSLPQGEQGEDRNG